MFPDVSLSGTDGLPDSPHPRRWMTRSLEFVYAEVCPPILARVSWRGDCWRIPPGDALKQKETAGLLP